MPPKRAITGDLDGVRRRTRQRPATQSALMDTSSVVFSDFNILPDMPIDTLKRFLPSDVVERVRSTEVSYLNFS
jgi:hypothetical protein